MSIKFNPTFPDLAHTAKFYGVYSRVGRKLGVTPQHVRRVALGLSTSRRVMKELESEIRRINGRRTEVAA